MILLQGRLHESSKNSSSCRRSRRVPDLCGGQISPTPGERDSGKNRVHRQSNGVHTDYRQSLRGIKQVGTIQNREGRKGRRFGPSVHSRRRGQTNRPRRSEERRVGKE